jgi:chromate transporter
MRAFGLSFDAPIPSSVDPWALGLSVVAVVAISRFKVGMIPTLLACAGAGVLLHLAGAVL